MLFERLLVTFEQLEDPRSSRNQKHPFISLISIGILSTLAGHESYSGMADFAQCHYDELVKLFPLPHGAPSHDTFQRIFDSIDPEAFLERFMIFTDFLADSVRGVTALDGKTIRNSGKNGDQLHVVSAWCEENRLVLGQVASTKKVGGELTSTKELIDILDIKDRIITLDALSCQKEIAQRIINKEGDYLIALKQNQKSLLEDVKAYLS